MKRVLAIICFLALPAAAQEYKIAVVSMLHAHVWLHLGTMLKGDKVKLVGVSETLPDLIARATREDVIPQTQNVTRPGVPQSLIFSDWKKMITAFDLNWICLLPLTLGIYQPLSNVATWLAVRLPSVSVLVANFGKTATAKPSAR